VNLKSNASYIAKLLPESGKDFLAPTATFGDGRVIQSLVVRVQLFLWANEVVPGGEDVPPIAGAFDAATGPAEKRRR
jgi:hypothetical protein